jgi:hypothetical protein
VTTFGETAARDGLAAAVPASILSGLPSTLHALATGRDPLEATMAAGSLVLPREHRPCRLIAAAGPVHFAVSLCWSVALAHLLPNRQTRTAGLLAGAVIAALDLGVIGWRQRRIRALPLLPQLTDHLAFGVVVAHVTTRRRNKRQGSAERWLRLRPVSRAAVEKCD